jgi:tryptophan halogenase
MNSCARRRRPSSLASNFATGAGRATTTFTAFGQIGRDQTLAKFYQYWLKLYQLGEAERARSVFDQHGWRRARPSSCVPPPDMPNSPLADIAYAFHFDAGLYAKFLRMVARSRASNAPKGKHRQHRTARPDGFIEAVVMESGETHRRATSVHRLLRHGRPADRADAANRLRGLELHWLPCDRAIAVPCVSDGALLAVHPFDRAPRPAGNGAFRCSTAPAMATCTQQIHGADRAAGDPDEKPGRRGAGRTAH